MELKKTKIGVLMGGWSPEREISLKTGQNITDTLKEAGYNVVGIDIGKSLKGGKYIPEKLLKHKIKIAFIALHGPYGEDGIIQGMLELLGISYTGSGVLASALAMDKILSKQIFKNNKILTPDFQVVKKDENFKLALNLPVIVKPNSQGSAIGVSIVQKRDDLQKALKLAFKYGNSVIIEKYIEGLELSVPVLDDPLKWVPRALPVIEIIPKDEFYTYESKYLPGASKHIIPAAISKLLYKKAQDIAVKVHTVLNCKGATRVDMIAGKNNNIYTLEINTIPGMTKTSLLPESAKKVGINFTKLLELMLKDVLR